MAAKNKKSEQAEVAAGETTGYGGFTQPQRMIVQNIRREVYGAPSDVEIGGVLFRQPVSGICSGVFRVDVSPLDAMRISCNRSLRVLSAEDIDEVDISLPEEVKGRELKDLG